MESSRDSSVWRSLAVTFGGGLALGAVGMKLTQSALRPVEIPPRPDINPVADRLNRMERRLERIEQTPGSSSAPAPAQLDQKVLEAVVGAVDARLHEHAAQVERRLADLEARIAVELESLRQQDRHVANAVGKSISEMQLQFRQEVGELRTAVENEMRQIGETVSQSAPGPAAAQAELQALHQRAAHLADTTEQRLVDMRQQFNQEAVELRATVEEEMRQVRETVSQTAAGQAAAQAELQEFQQRAAHLADTTEQRLADMRQKFQQEAVELRTSVEQMRQVRETVSQTAAGQAAAQAELQEFQQQAGHLADTAEQRLADMQYQLRQEMTEHRTEIDDELGRFGNFVSKTVTEQVDRRTAALEQSIETRIVTAAAAATAARFEEQLAPLRAEVQHKEQELAELRQRLSESEKAVLDVILAIGQVCRQAAERIGGGTAAPVAMAPPSRSTTETPAPEVPPAAVAEAPAPTAQEAGEATPAHAEPEAISPPITMSEVQTLDQALPDFLQPALRSRPWRIPLVSSFLVTTGCLLLLRYL